MGTADYMAPEQASDSHAVDIRADIYSLGCTLYKLLAGCAPFEGSQYKGTFEKMTAHVQHSVPPIENLLPQIPRELAAIIEKMLAKDPAERFAQPADVIEALTPFCADAAVSELLIKVEEAKTLHSDQENPNESPLSRRERARVRADQVDDSNRPATQPIRRRTSSLAVIGLLLFVLGFAAGFSLGIIVMIKKGGKTTTIDAPDGSNVKVNDKGNVTVDLNQLKDKSATDFHRIDLSASDGKADLPPEPYIIAPGDVLQIKAIGTLVDQPIDSTYLVEQAGTVAPGPAYGRVKIQGLSLVEAEKAIQESLKKVLRNPEVSVTLLGWRDRSTPAIKLPEPYIIGLGDTLRITALGTLIDQPIDDYFVVEPMGTVALPPDYGRVKVQGLSIEQAEKTVEKSLEKVLRQPTVSISLMLWQDPSKYTLPPQPPRIAPGNILDILAANTLLDQPINGPYLVESDGQVTLGPGYGRVNLKGQTFEEAQETVKNQLSKILRSPEVSITLKGWRGSLTRTAKDTTPVSRSSTNVKNQQPLRGRQRTEAAPVIPDLPMPSTKNEWERYISPQMEMPGSLPTGLLAKPSEQALPGLPKEQRKLQEESQREPGNEGKITEQEKRHRTADGKVVPDSYRLGPGDILVIFNDRGGRGAGRRERLGDGIEISKTGIAYLGPYYGELKLQALSLDEAERVVEKILQEDITKYNPEISITVLDKEDPSKQRKIPDSYRISSEDILNIKISATPYYQSPRRDGALTVQPDGYIDMGQLEPSAGFSYKKIKDLTITEAEILVRDSLIEINKKHNWPKIEIILHTLRKTEQISTEQRKQRYTVDMIPVPDSYKLSQDDRIFIHYNVSREMGSRKYGISIKSTGVIPLIGSDDVNYGEINVLGMTLDEAEAAIAKRIKEVRSNPTVSIALIDDFDKKKQDINKDSYHIVPGDRLQIQVPIMPDGYLSTKIISGVQPDGNVILNLNQNLTFQLKLGGLTVREAEKSIRDFLITKVETPKVTVQLYTIKKTEQDPPDVIEPKGRAPSLNLPSKSVEMTIMQREEQAIPGSDGSVRIRLGDITDGQVFISVVTADKDFLLQRTSISQGDNAGFSVGKKQYAIHVKELRNILIGQDFAKLIVSESASDSSAEKRRATGNIALITATGTIEPMEVLDVTAQVSGRIVSFGDDPRGATDPSFKGKTIDYNSPVEEGTVLARIDDTLYKARVEQEQAGYKRAEAELKMAVAKYKSAQEQAKLGLAKDDPSLEAGVSAAEAGLALSKAALDTAKINLDNTVIKSPVKGMIIARRINVGQNVAPNTNEVPSLFLIAKDLRKMQVWASVSEADITRIHEGMTASFTVDAFPKEVFTGKVVQIRHDAAQVQNNVVYTVVINFDNPDLKLLPYMTANLKFEIEKEQNPASRGKVDLPKSENKKVDDQTLSPATEVAVAVLDDCDPNYKGSGTHGDGIRLIAADGKELYIRKGLNNCQTIGANHGVVIDSVRGHVFFRELVTNRVTGMDFAGKTLFQTEMGANSLAVDPRTGNLWCLTGTGTINSGKTSVLDSNGGLIQTYTLDGFDIAYDPHDDAFWSVGEYVMKFNRQGEILFRTTKAKWSYASVAPNKQDGSAWVVERNHPDVPGSANRLLLFDDKGHELKKLDLEGRDPFGVACDSETGTAWVVILRKGILRVPVKGEPLPLFDFPAESISIGPDSGQIWIGTQTEMLRLDKEGKVLVRYPLGCESGQSWLSAR